MQSPIHQLKRKDRISQQMFLPGRVVLLPNIKGTRFPCARELLEQECSAKHMTPQLYKNHAQHTWVLLEERHVKVAHRKMEATYENNIKGHFCILIATHK